jgi:tripartite-type tricarboxylate transporter receptor subunit TctC
MVTSRVASCLFLLTLFAAAPTHAQSYPAKPVRIVVGFSAGGAIDIVARRLAQKLTESLGQQFIVENRVGAGSVIGTDYVAKAAPDGYTLLLSGVTGLAAGASVFKQLPYDTRRDFAPVILVLQNPAVLIVHPSVPAKTVKEFIALVKSRPGKLNYASSGAGGGQHLAAEMFIMTTGVNLVHVPYKGAAPALNDLVGGQVDLMFESIPTSAIQFIETGKLRALAVTSPRRSKLLPAVPTMQEAGLKGFEFRTWMGLAGPAGTPKEVVARLNAATNKVIASGDLRAWLEGLGLEIAGGTPEQFQAFLEKEIDMYARIVKASGMPLL